MAAFLDGCRFNPAAGGTTDWTYSSVVTGYQTPAAAGVVNGRLYKYRAESADLSQWEFGEGAYNTSTGVLARTTVLYNSSGGASKINFSTVPQVAVVALKEDLISVEEANSFTSAQKDQASTNIGTMRAVRKQVFTSSGTYTPDPHLLYAVIDALGGGGGGGGITGPGANMAESSPGGGAGSRSITYASAATIGVSQTVTIGTAGAAGAAGGAGGAGGDTSVGSLCIGKGGAGGGAGGVGVPGSGGVAGSGDITAPGQNGFAGYYIHVAGVIIPSGAGGSSPYGAGGLPVLGNGSSVSGNAATGKGVGGSGASSQGTTATATGGAGTAGLVVVTEYCSQ